MAFGIVKPIGERPRLNPPTFRHEPAGPYSARLSGQAVFHPRVFPAAGRHWSPRHGARRRDIRRRELLGVPDGFTRNSVVSGVVENNDRIALRVPPGMRPKFAKAPPESFVEAAV